MQKLISLLQQNARLSNAQLAVMLGKTEEEVAADIRKLEEDGIIKGYSVILNEEAINKDMVTAIVELRVTRSGTADLNPSPVPSCNMMKWKASP